MFIAALFTTVKQQKDPGVHQRWMNKQSMVHPYKGLFSLKKERNSDTRYNTDEPEDMMLMK